MIRVMIAEDQALVRGAFAALLRLEPDFDVLGEAATADEILAAVPVHRPDIVLLDIQMPGRDGLSVIQELRAMTRIIVLTTFGRPGYVARAMTAGASGFLVKDAAPERLIDAVRKVHAGLRVVDPQLATDSLSFGINPLTVREQEILLAAADGRTVSELARRLHLSDGTVRNHLSAAIGKTGAQTRAEAVRIASERGWL